jgi:branched-chain amino acid transport system substrate-binding protein
MDGANKSIVEVVKKSHAQGWHPLFVSVSFLAVEPFIQQAGADAEGTVVTEVVPYYERTELPTVALYRKLLAKYAPGKEPNFVNFEGFIDAMVLCEAFKRSGRDLTRTKLIKSIETMNNLDIGLGPDFKLKFSAKRHKGFDGLATVVVRNGKVNAVTDWKTLKQ